MACAHRVAATAGAFGQKPIEPDLRASRPFFARPPKRRLQRGAFHSLVDQAAINRY
jgi:hypothetical protein